MCQAFIVEISLRANISLESVSELVENCILCYKNVVIDCVLKMKLENSIIDGMAVHKSFLATAFISCQWIENRIVKDFCIEFNLVN